MLQARLTLSVVPPEGLSVDFKSMFLAKDLEKRESVIALCIEPQPAYEPELGDFSHSHPGMWNHLGGTRYKSPIPKALL